MKLNFVKVYFLFFCVTIFCSQALANTIIDVGLGPVPDSDPAHGSNWTLSSSCVDINENGEAACQTQAYGPTYGCGWRNAQSCRSTIKLVHLWTGNNLTLMSGPYAEYDVPRVMNNNGEIGGYAYINQVYPPTGGNGRIWSIPGSPELKDSIVISLNDNGDYILEWLDTPGGISHYTSFAFLADGTEITRPGTFVRPFVIGNNDDIIGAQIIQNFVMDIHSPTGNEIPEVSGVGWLLTQQEVDALPINEAGLFDTDGDNFWPATFYRPTASAYYKTSVSDVNDSGEFIVETRFGGLFSSNYCSLIGESQITAFNGGTHPVPWVCESTNYTGGTYAGGKAFRGINNIGDAVGAFTPGAYSYQSTYPTYPWVWLKNSQGGWDEYNANELLPAASEYTIISVSDVNDSRQIVGNCINNSNAVKTGCILELTDHPVPLTLDISAANIDTPAAGDAVSDVVDINVTVAGADIPTHPISPTPPTPLAGEQVEGDGSITAVASGAIEINGVITYYNDATNIKFNDVTDFAVSLPVQYKGILAADGTITVTDLEIN